MTLPSSRRGTDEPPTWIGPYQVVRVLGEGGMGAVYLARDPAIDRLVAIKLLRDGLDTPAYRTRLTREATAAARLHHPNVVIVHGMGEWDGRIYVVMQYVDGQPLAELIRDRQPADMAQRLALLEGLAAGLVAVHEAGLVHRDVKPANVIVDARWCPTLVDFGLVVLPDASFSLTGQQSVVGTLSYMSPEQVMNEDVDHRSDLYSFCVLAYELLTFQRAFAGDSRQVVAQILAGAPTVPIERSGLDDALVALLTRGLSLDRESRWQDAESLREALRRARLAHTSQPVATDARAGANSAGAPRARANANGAPLSDSATRRRTPRLWQAVTATGAVVAALSAFVFVQGRSPGMASAPTAPPVSQRADVRLPSTAPRAEALTAVRAPAAASDIRSRAPVSAPPVPVAVERTVAAPLLLAAGPSSRDTADTRAVERAEAVRPRLPIGTELMVRVESPLDSRTSAPGDLFVGTLDQSVAGVDGAHLAAGRRVRGRVDQSGRAPDGRPLLRLSLIALSTDGRERPLRTGLYTALAPPAQPGRPAITALLIGAAAGTLAGATLDGANGAVAGAAVGVIGAASLSRDTSSSEFRIANAVPFRLSEALSLDGTE